MRTQTKIFTVRLLHDLLKSNDLCIDNTETDKSFATRFKTGIPQNTIYLAETTKGELVADYKSSIVINTLLELHGKMGSVIADRKLMLLNVTAVVLQPGEDIEEFFKLV